MPTNAAARTLLLLTAGLASTASIAAADYRLEKNVPIAAGGTFSVRTEAGGLTVRGPESGAANSGAAIVLITSDRDDFAERFDVRIETPSSDRAELVIERKSRAPFSWFFDGFSGRANVEVTLPANVGADLRSSGGGIEATNIGGALEASSSGGGIQASNIAGAADLSSSGGSVRAEGVAGDVSASSSGGGVHVFEAGGAVVADSSGGSVSVSFAPGNARGGSLDSSGGGVKATVDPSVALEIDASSSGGSVDCDLPVTVRGRADRDSLKGQMNGGGALLKLRSSGGGVTLAER